MPIRTHVQLLEDIRRDIVDNSEREISEAEVRSRMIDVVDTMFGSPTTTTIIPDGTAAEPTLRWDPDSSAWTAASQVATYYVTLTEGPVLTDGVKESAAILGLYANGGRRWPPSYNISSPPSGYVEPNWSASTSGSFVWNTDGVDTLDTDQITNTWPLGGDPPVFTVLFPSWYGFAQEDWFFRSTGAAANPSAPSRDYVFDGFRDRWVRIDGVTYDAWYITIDAASETRPDSSWLTSRLFWQVRQSPPSDSGHTFELVT